MAAAAAGSVAPEITLAWFFFSQCLIKNTHRNFEDVMALHTARFTDDFPAPTLPLLQQHMHFFRLLYCLCCLPCAPLNCSVISSTMWRHWQWRPRGSHGCHERQDNSPLCSTLLQWNFWSQVMCDKEYCLPWQKIASLVMIGQHIIIIIFIFKWQATRGLDTTNKNIKFEKSGYFYFILKP